MGCGAVLFVQFSYYKTSNCTTPCDVMYCYLRFLYSYAILQAILVRFLRFGEYAYLKVWWVAYISFYSIKKQKQYSL